MRAFSRVIEPRAQRISEVLSHVVFYGATNTSIEIHMDSPIDECLHNSMISQDSRPHSTSFFS